MRFLPFFESLFANKAEATSSVHRRTLYISRKILNIGMDLVIYLWKSTDNIFRQILLTLIAEIYAVRSSQSRHITILCPTVIIKYVTIARRMRHNWFMLPKHLIHLEILTFLSCVEKGCESWPRLTTSRHRHRKKQWALKISPYPGANNGCHTQSNVPDHLWASLVSSK